MAVSCFAFLARTIECSRLTNDYRTLKHEGHRSQKRRRCPAWPAAASATTSGGHHASLGRRSQESRNDGESKQSNRAARLCRGSGLLAIFAGARVTISRDLFDRARSKLPSRRSMPLSSQSSATTSGGGVRSLSATKRAAALISHWHGSRAGWQIAPQGLDLARGSTRAEPFTGRSSASM